ncbi:polyprotein-like [Trifolium medium]|uniref:Polyprotein-like n=1 Tax=Trifolium medium TaxID=97028 RepID=A0A392QYL2_9FABA|nr:polyprotein-like [Trifolium medium]
MPTAYKSKGTKGTSSTSKDRGKTVCLGGSSADSQDPPEAPPSKCQKEEKSEQDSQLPDQGYPALAITSHHFSGVTSQSSPSDDNSQNSTWSEDSSTIAAKSESEETLMNISKLFMVNFKE